MDVYCEIDMVWIEKYLNHEFNDICTFSRMFRKTFSDSENRNKKWYDFLGSLPQVKYEWDRFNQYEKEQHLKDIKAKLEAITS